MATVTTNNERNDDVFGVFFSWNAISHSEKSRGMQSAGCPTQT